MKTISLTAFSVALPSSSSQTFHHWMYALYPLVPIKPIYLYGDSLFLTHLLQKALPQ